MFIYTGYSTSCYRYDVREAINMFREGFFPSTPSYIAKYPHVIRNDIKDSLSKCLRLLLYLEYMDMDMFILDTFSDVNFLKGIKEKLNSFWDNGMNDVVYI